MKILLKMFVVLATVSFTQLAVAREALLEATIKDIKVTSVAPAVQEQLNKASPEERKSLEAAIHTGNLFIPQYFSYNAFDSDPENVDWEKETRPLISLDREEWEQQYDQMGIIQTWGGRLPKDVDATINLTCPQIELISIKQDGYTSSLVYRSTSVGTLISFTSSLYEFVLENAGDIYDVQISLNQKNELVGEVIPKDKRLTWSYTKSIAFMKRYLGDHGVAAFTTKQHENEMIRTYKSSIEKIEKSAAKYCK
jgi:hypothetical protein